MVIGHHGAGPHHLGADLSITRWFLKTVGRGGAWSLLFREPSRPSAVTSAAPSLLCLQNYFESYLTVASTVSNVLCLMANFLLVNR